MHEPDPRFPDAAVPPPLDSGHVLQMLAGAGNYERVEREASRFLDLNPEDTDAHYYRALALVELGNPAGAVPHLDFLLEREPEEPRTHVIAGLHAWIMQDWKRLRRHVSEGMRIDPGRSLFHRLAAIEALRRIDLREARRHIEHARRLDPNDAETAALYIQIHGADRHDALSAIDRLDQCREALKLDPENATLYNSMGDIHMQDLDDPGEAEPLYREALRLEPRNQTYQKDLFHAVAKRSLVYRLFSIPSRTFAWLGGFFLVARHQPWRILLLLFALKAVAIFFLWLLVVTVLFWPGCKVYEWLLVSEIRNAGAVSHRKLRILRRFHRWPLWRRFGLFLAVNAALWSALFAALGVSQSIAFIVVAAIAGFHWIIVAALHLKKRLEVASARRALASRASSRAAG